MVIAISFTCLSGTAPLTWGETALPRPPLLSAEAETTEGGWPVSPWKGLPSLQQDKIGRHCSGTISSEVWGLGLLHMRDSTGQSSGRPCHPRLPHRHFASEDARAQKQPLRP